MQAACRELAHRPLFRPAAEGPALPFVHWIHRSTKRSRKFYYIQVLRQSSLGVCFAPSPSDLLHREFVLHASPSSLARVRPVKTARTASLTSRFRRLVVELIRDSRTANHVPVKAPESTDIGIRGPRSRAGRKPATRAQTNSIFPIGIMSTDRP